MTDSESPIQVDQARMERALASPHFLIPEGLTAEQVGQFIDAVAKATEVERERCAVIAEDMDYGDGIAAAIRKG